jgi:hypothetical protein
VSAFDFDLRFVGPGVYHLILNDEVVYVGASQNVSSRIRSWHCVDSPLVFFDRVEVYPVKTKRQLAELEHQHIRQYQPKHNLAGITSPYIKNKWTGPLPEKAKSKKYAKKIGRRLNEDDLDEITKPRRYLDGDGLYLVVKPSGAKSWLYRYMVDGRRRDMGLGSYPTVSLAEARERHDWAKAYAKNGIDPMDFKSEMPVRVREQIQKSRHGGGIRFAVT